MPKRWKLEEKLDIVRTLEEGIVPVKGLAKRYNTTVDAIYLVNKRTKKAIANGLINVEEKTTVVREKPKTGMGQIKEICERMGYDPAEGYVAYRKLLEEMVSEKADEANFSHAAKSAFSKAGTLADEEKHEYIQRLAEIMDLKREAATIDKELLPYLYPKLTSSSVKVEQERPPLLVIEDPADKKAK